MKLKLTGRRPNVSDRLPKIGPNINCITANTLANIPPQTAASATVLPGSTSVIRLGKTGIIIPIQLSPELRLNYNFIGKLVLFIMGVYANFSRVHAQFLS